MNGYRPEMVDLLCLSGQLKWIGQREETAEGDSPRRIWFAPREYWPHLRLHVPGAEPDDPKDTAVLAKLRDGGAQYLDQLSDRAGISERDTLKALWRLVNAGLVTIDSYATFRVHSNWDRALKTPP